MRPPARPLALVALVCLAVAAGPAPSKTPAGAGDSISRRGTYEGGQYQIEVPAGWNGGLVLYAHGFGGTQASPLASHLLDSGYALATSSYRAEGYRVDWFVDDMRALLELFIREVRRPRWTIVHGRSMGGHVAIASLELHPGLYQGALIDCGIIDGVGIADFYLAARAAAEYLSGINLFEAPERETLIRRVNEQWLPLAIHETGDGRVPWSLQQAYRRRTLAAGTSHLLVQRAVRWPGHCAMDGEVREQAFDDLVAWLERGTRPDGDDVLAADVSTLGLRWTRILHPEDPARRSGAAPK
jgi:pimeloyl-ACP methyl ester carboxylesterase